MVYIYPKEQLLVDMIAQKMPEMADFLKNAVGKIMAHLPERLMHEKYDKTLVNEFLKELIKNCKKLGLEKYFTVVTEDDTAHTLRDKCLAPNKLNENLFKSLGSYGITKLIEDVLKKMAESGFAKKDAENLVALIETRNKLRQAEEKFLRDAFVAYLEKQISLYS